MCDPILCERMDRLINLKPYSRPRNPSFMNIGLTNIMGVYMRGVIGKVQLQIESRKSRSLLALHNEDEESLSKKF